MGARAKRPAGLRTTETILEAARRLFLRQGYHATGMRQIANDSGISLSAVYNHFASKEEIFEAILSNHNLYAAMADALSGARGETVAELMESGFIEIMSTLKGRQEYLLLIFIDVLEFQARHASSLAAGTIPRMLQFFERIYAVGRQRGELRDISPVLLGRAYMQLVFSSFVLEDVVRAFAHDEIGKPFQVENWEHGLMDVLLHGVLKDGSRIDGRVDR